MINDSQVELAFHRAIAFSGGEQSSGEEQKKSLSKVVRSAPLVDEWACAALHGDIICIMQNEIVPRGEDPVREEGGV